MVRPTYTTLETNLRTEGLGIFGGFHPALGDSLPEEAATLLLLGPDEPGFWPRISAAPEMSDGAADPLDRWSGRVIGRIASDLGGTALFPFTGPPWLPFQSWAMRSGRAWASPVRLLVHDRAGLMVSYRGALALPWRLDLPPPPTDAPCLTCAGHPCLTACPASALTSAGYDLPRCHDYLDTAPGQNCLSGGCAVRRACPVSQSYGRLPEQSAYHMRRFHS